MDKLLKHVGANIRKLRKEKALTQNELAIKITKKKSWISKLENGKGNPTIESLLGLAGALDIEVWKLLRLNEEELDYPEALQEFQQYINSTKSKISNDEMHFLKLLKIGGRPPRDKETYLLSWLLLRFITDKNLTGFFKLEVSKVDGDIIGTFKVHMG